MNQYLFLLLSISALFSCRVRCASKEWAWLYQKTLSNQELHNNKNKQELVFSRLDVPLFSQLIFSWNAFRPKKGYFSFMTQARNAHNKQWGKWHTMFDWGSNVQRSYCSHDAGSASHIYVRLEAASGKFIDAFRIKIVAREGAKLSHIRSFSAATSNMYTFKPEVIHNQLLRLPSIHIKGVPQFSQFALDHHHNDRICSPTSCSMLTSFLIKQIVNPIEFAHNAFDNGLNAYGSWPFNMVHAFERCEGRIRFFTARLSSFINLYKQLQRGIPVVVSVRGTIQGAPRPYKNGHLLVVVGWNAKKQRVLCHDPAFESDDKVLTSYPLESFLRAWERSKRLAYIAEPI